MMFSAFFLIQAKNTGRSPIRGRDCQTSYISLVASPNQTVEMHRVEIMMGVQVLCDDSARPGGHNGVYDGKRKGMVCFFQSQQ